MKTSLLGGAMILSFAFSFSSPAAEDGAKAQQLAAKYNCQACHAVDKKVVGPGYKEIAKKYAGDNSAPAKLGAEGEERRQRRVGYDSDAAQQRSRRRHQNDRHMGAVAQVTRASDRRVTNISKPDHRHHGTGVRRWDHRRGCRAKRKPHLRLTGRSIGAASC